jgi:uncharacterized membrane protein YbhN (UPF0104 family)
VGDRRTRLLLILILRIALMLGVLIPRVHLSSLLPAWSPSVGAWLVAAVVSTALGVGLAVLRWQTVLTGMGFGRAADEAADPVDPVLDDPAYERALLGLDADADVPLDPRPEPGTTDAPVDLGLHRLGRHYLAGLFMGNFLPSTIGGDVLRIRRLSQDNGLVAESVASVVLERLTGWVVLPFITLVSLAANPGLRDLGEASALAAGVAVATLVVLAVVLVAVGHPRVGGRFTGGAGWHRFASTVHLGLDRLRRHPTAAVGMLATGLAYQLAVVLAAFCAAHALQIHAVGLTACLAFFPAVAIVQVVPITLGGLGAREWALVLFLHPLGVPTGRAVALGLVVYGLNLLVSFAGAPSFALGGRKSPVPELSSDRT